MVYLAEGTTVLTPTGYVNINTLVEGNNIITSMGTTRTIKIQSKIFDASENSTIYPYIIPIGAIGSNYPPKQIKISGGHLIKYNSNWIMPYNFTGLVQDKTTTNIIQLNYLIIKQTI